MTTKWEDLKHKSSPEERERIHKEALAELDATQQEKVILPDAEELEALESAPSRPMSRLKALLNKRGFFGDKTEKTP